MKTCAGLSIRQLLDDRRARYPEIFQAIEAASAKRGGGGGKGGGGGGGTRVSPQVSRAVRNYIACKPPSVGGQFGSHVMFDVAIALYHGFGLGRDDSLYFLEEFNSSKCQPEWTQKELNHKLDDAIAKSESGAADGGKPRGHLISEPPKTQSPSGPKSGWNVNTLPVPTGPLRTVDPATDDPNESDPPQHREEVPPADAGGGIRPKKGRAGARLDSNGFAVFYEQPPEIFQEFRNFYIDGEDNKGQPLRVPHVMPDIYDQHKKIFGEWPKVAGGVLFVPGPDNRPRFLPKPINLIAWMDARSQVKWSEGADFIDFARYHDYLLNEAPIERYTSVETTPHWPKISDSFYMCRTEYPDGLTGALDELVNMFSLETTHDYSVMKCTVLTGVWGGPPGKRPLVAVTAPDDDPRKGRGIGKSTIPAVLSQGLFGGMMEISPSEDIKDIKVRMLSEGGRTTRIGRIDNLKSLKFSWGDFEGLLTSPYISGKMLYVGERRVPNYMFWILTVNGANMSTDMAERSIKLVCKRVDYRPGWEESVLAFIHARFHDIMQDCRHYLLNTAPAECDRSLRWSEWDKHILSKMPEPDALRVIITERQSELDGDSEETVNVREFFARKIQEASFTPEGSQAIRISISRAAQWLSEAIGQPCPVGKATPTLRGLGLKSGDHPALSYHRTKSARFWVWRGEGCHPESMPRQGQEL